MAHPFIQVTFTTQNHSSSNKKLSWCWQTRTTHLEVNQCHQTWYHSICYVWFRISVLQ